MTFEISLQETFVRCSRPNYATTLPSLSTIVEEIGTLSFDSSKGGAPLTKYEKIPTPTSMKMITIDNNPVNLSRGFEDLHSKVYDDILKGNGLRPSDIKTTMSQLDILTSGEDK